MSLTDAELVADIDAVGSAAFGALFERHRAGMVASAARVLGSSADVEDVVHESLLVAWARIGNLRDPAAAGPWLRGIVRNVALQHIRGTREVPTERVEPRGASAGPDWPDRLIEDAAMRDWLWSALNELTEPLRLAVVLRHFSRASTYQDIASLSGVPVGTVRSRLNEARRRLAMSVRYEAAVAYGSHDRAVSARRRHFVEAFDGYNRGDGSLYFDALTEDVEVHADGTVERGRTLAMAGVCDDMAVGMRLRVLDVIAGRDITVVEGRFENPPDDPAHCPVATTQVYLHAGHAVRSIRLHFGPGAEPTEHAGEASPPHT